MAYVNNTYSAVDEVLGVLPVLLAVVGGLLEAVLGGPPEGGGENTDGYGQELERSMNH